MGVSLSHQPDATQVPVNPRKGFCERETFFQLDWTQSIEVQPTGAARLKLVAIRDGMMNAIAAAVGSMLKAS